MLALQRKHPVEHRLGIGPAIDEVADEDDPAARVIGCLPQLGEDRVELFDLPVDVTDDGDRTLNA